MLGDDQPVSLPVFGESEICNSRAHCATCRARSSGGVAFRTSLGKRFSGIGEEIECPHGMPWDWNPASGIALPAPLPLGPTQAPPIIPPEPIQPVPRNQWPLAVRVVARLKRDGEPGVGATLARLIAGVGGEQYKRLMKRIGIDCGCSARQAMLDAKYPYDGAGCNSGA